MNDMRGFAAAQRAYDNMTPPDDGPCECPECDGTGVNKLVIGDHDDTCQCCDGSGMLNENGEPFDPHQAEREACDYADMKRDERLTNNEQYWSEA